MRRTRGFTLVELLVVIGIIGLLIAILLPALNKAREQAKKVSCASNERQLWLAFSSYMNENNGRCPIPSRTSDTAPDLPVCYVMVQSGIADYDHGTWWPYIAPPGNARYGVMNCPSDVDSGRAVRQGSLSILPRNFSYSLNGLLRHGPWPGAVDGTGVKLSAVRRASEKIIIMEEHWPNDAYCLIPNDPPDLDDVPTNRHAGRGNFCFGDGHVDAFTPMDLGYSTNDPTDPAIVVANPIVHDALMQLYK